MVAIAKHLELCKVIFISGIGILQNSLSRGGHLSSKWWPLSISFTHDVKNLFKTEMGFTSETFPSFSIAVPSDTSHAVSPGSTFPLQTNLSRY